MTIRLKGLALCALPLLLAACTTSGTPAASSPTPQPPSIADAKGNWVLTELKGQAPLDDTTITATFDANGEVSGSGGCNVYGLTFAVEGDALKLASPPRTTMMACEPDVMTQETAFLAAMGDVRNLSASDTKLDLKDASGATVLSFTAGIRSLAGTSWKATGILSGGGVSSLVEGTDVTLEIAADGAVSGSAGCNRFTGKATLGEGTIAFGPLASTMMACVEPAGAMEQETAYLAALESATTWQVDGAKLTLRNGDTTAATFTQA